ATTIAHRPHARLGVVLALPGGVGKPLVGGRDDYIALAWTADGSTLIVLRRSRSGREALLGIDPSTGAVHQLPPIPREDHAMSQFGQISPDGTRIALERRIRRPIGRDPYTRGAELVVEDIRTGALSRIGPVV